MLYQDKYFDQDKNSILRAAQGFVEPQLLQRWVEIAFDSYMALENPMGLVDDFILRLKSIEKYDTSLLEELYEILAAIYRYEKGIISWKSSGTVVATTKCTLKTGPKALKNGFSISVHSRKSIEPF